MRQLEQLLGLFIAVILATTARRRRCGRRPHARPIDALGAAHVA
jgi:hypothetical protein